MVYNLQGSTEFNQHFLSLPNSLEKDIGHFLNSALTEELQTLNKE